MGKAILGVVVGFVIWSVAWLGGGVALQAVFPDSAADDGTITNDTMMIAALVLSVVCSVLAGVSCRALAGAGRSVLVLAVVLLLVGIGVQGSAWDTMPLWFHLPFLIMIVPMTLLGGRLVKRAKA